MGAVEVAELGGEDGALGFDQPVQLSKLIAVDGAWGALLGLPAE
jgi:hypothetical protein